mmetsp:Transcript_11321/g.27123  ORF Transcript_11321/g.27123 Transcript_11321/m.27123 type:complete len:247 (-) Transcript_11321:498-1238(-)
MLNPIHELQDHAGPHGMTTKHDLVLFLVVHGLDGVLQHGVIPVPLLHIHGIQAPIVAQQRHVPPAVVANVRQTLNHFRPHPIPADHIVRPPEPLHRPHPHAVGVQAIVCVQGHVLQPAGQILKHGDDHVLTPPDPVPKQVPHALTALPQLQPRGHNPRHHHHRVFGFHPLAGQQQARPVDTLVLRRVGVGPPGLELLVQGEVPVRNALRNAEQGSVVGLHLDNLRGHHVRQRRRDMVLVDAREDRR